MTTYWLSVQLQSDATFGRGDGVAGLVDVEIEHDDLGCPYLGGRALKGLLVEEYANIRTALSDETHWDIAATALFGKTGAAHGTDVGALLHIGSAQLPADLRAALRADIDRNLLDSREVLALFTTIRRQTSVTSQGAPNEGSLRAMRVLLRETSLIAELHAERELSERERGLLAACVLGVRRAGLARNRGRGRVALLLHTTQPTSRAALGDRTTTEAWFELFAREVLS
jgi:hypothetical protein